MRKKIAGRYFEWDEEKNRLNKQKHKVSFETAARVFSDPFFVECPDETHSDEDLRYKVLGMVNMCFSSFVRTGRTRHASYPRERRMPKKGVHTMAIVRKYIRFDTPLTPEQIQELEEMEKAPIVYDEDCPPMTEKELEKTAAIVRERDADRKRESISLDVLPSTVRVAQRYGKGFMARLLDLAVQDEALMKKCL